MLPVDGIVRLYSRMLDWVYLQTYEHPTYILSTVRNRFSTIFSGVARPFSSNISHLEDFGAYEHRRPF